MADNNKITDWEDVPVDNITDWEDVQDNSSNGFLDAISSVGTGAMDVSRGVARGATMEFLDEILGGASTLGEKAYETFNPTDIALRKQGFTLPETSMGDLYSQNTERIRQELAKSEERSPGLTMLGQLGGSLIPAIGATAALKGMGAIKTGGKETLKKILETQGKAAAGKELGKRALVLGGLGGAEGAVEGALTAVGTSETPLSKESIPEAFEGAKTGAMFGTGLGLLPLAKDAGSDMLSKFVQEKPFLRKVEASYGLGKQGINPASEVELGTISGDRKSPVALAQYGTEKAQSLLNNLMDTRSRIGKQVGASLENAANSGVQVKIDNVNDIISKVERTFNSTAVFPEEYPRAQKFLEILKTRGNDSTSVMDVRDFLGDVDSMIDSLNRLTTKDPATEMLLRGLGDVRTSISNQLKTAIPEYKDAAERYFNYNQVLEAVYKGDKPSGVGDVFLSNIKRDQVERKLFDNLKQMLTRTTEAGESSSKSREMLLNFLDQFSKFEKYEANRALKSGGFDNLLGNKIGREDIGLTQTRKELEKVAQSTSDMQDVLNSFRSSRADTGFQSSGKNILGGIAEGAKAETITGANLTGRIMSSGPADLARKIYNYPNEQLYKFSDSLLNHPKLTKYGTNLREALDSKDLQKRHAMLFILMQNPETRQIMQDTDIEEMPSEN